MVDEKRASDRRKADNGIETRVALLEREIVNFSSFFAKLDSAMEKLADVSSSIKEMLSVHESRLNQHSQQNDYIEELLENRRNYFEGQKSELTHKLEQTQENLRKEMDKVEETVIEQINELKKEIRAYHEETVKIYNILDKFKIMFSIGAALVGFILFKMGIIPFPFQFAP